MVATPRSSILLRTCSCAICTNEAALTRWSSRAAPRCASCTRAFKDGFPWISTSASPTPAATPIPRLNWRSRPRPPTRPLWCSSSIRALGSCGFVSSACRLSTDSCESSEKSTGRRATRRRQRPRPATRRRGAELSRPNAQRQPRPDSDRLDPRMCEERRPRATARRCALAPPGQRNRRPPKPIAADARTVSSTVSSPASASRAVRMQGPPPERACTQPASPAP